MSPAPAWTLDDGLTSFELHLLGLQARPEPELQVVPRNTPTGLRVELDFESSTADVSQMLALLPSGLEVAAELVGPGIDVPIQLRGPPGKLLPIPPLVQRGMYLVRDLRLELDSELFVRALPDSASVEVIERVLVTQVTTRPLDAEEIRQKGILFGEDDFTGFNFTLALKLDSRPVNIDFPVVFDANDVLVPTRASANIDLQGTGSALPLVNAQFQPVMLKLELPEAKELELPEGVGDISIPGLLVIPGDVGFLNQFFSAMLVVSNGAPLGSKLSVRDLVAEIELPPGEDGVAGTGDDPLLVAETAGGQSFTLPIVGLGPDGVLGTADDKDRFLPGEQGQAEYLLEGQKEGFHNIDFTLTGRLDGLPAGPVEITGTARGGVVVRNPYFNLTFSAPRTVRRFEEFTLFVSETNTSGTVANLVQVALNALQLSGAELLSSASMPIDSLAPGDSATVRFRFRSLQTGEVTTSYLSFDQGAGGGNDGDLLFRLGVGERGAPLSPDTLVLPTSVEALPADVVDQALRVLGQAWSVATAPTGTLPENVVRVSKQVVVDRALEVAEAGLRVQLGEDLSAALSSLAFTWLATSDGGFEQLLRETRAGEAFQAAVGAEIRTSDATSVFHEALSARLTSRPPHLLVSVGDGALAAPITWEVRDAAGRALRVAGSSGSEELFTADLPNAGLLPLTDPVDAGRGAALVTSLGANVYEVHWTAIAAGNLDLAVSLPRPDGSVGVQAFAATAIGAGSMGKVKLDLVSPPAPLVMTIDADGDGTYEQSVGAAPELVLQPSGPTLLSANVVGPETLSGADSFGRAVALLFDRELRRAEADVAGHYTVDAHRVLSARAQLSGRLVFLFLEQPAGALVPRELAVSGLFDTTGRPMALETRTLGSMMVPPDASGAIVSGRVLDAEGAPILGAQVVYSNSTASGAGLVGIAQQFTDADGAYQFDWVRRADIGPFVIQAVDPATGGFQERATSIRNDGERLVVDLVMRGRGGVTGLVTDLSGDPVPAARVLVTSAVDPASFAVVESDGEGRYVATDIIVGPVDVKAVSGTSSGLASGNLQRAGTFTTVDVSINTGVGNVVTRVLQIDGADVTTPVSRARVFYLIPAAGGIEIVVGSGDTDPEGLFVFEDVPTGPFRIAAFDLVRGIQASKTGELVVQGTDVIVNGCVDGECQVLFQEEAVGTLTGEVRLASGAPAAGARVQAGGLQTIAAADGTFQIDAVATGSHAVHADFGPGRHASATVNVVTGTTVNVSLTLPGVGTVAVTVLDAISGAPLVGQTVIRVTSGCAGFPQVTNGSGVATFADVPIPGAYFKALRDTDVAHGYATVRHDGDATAIALRFGGFGTVTGTVVDAGDDPVAGADVVLAAKVPSAETCSLVQQVRARQLRTGSDGTFVFTNVPVGAVHVSASSFFLPIPAAASDNLLAHGDVKSFTLRLLSDIAGELNGTVYLSDGTTPAGPDVLVTVSGGRPDVTVRTDAAGRYSFAKIFPRGPYTLTAADPVTGKVAKEWIQLQADQDLTTDLRLLGLGTIDVAVLDGGGTPIEDAFVELKGAQYPYFKSAGAVTPEDGGAIRFDRVPEGRFSVTASDNEGRGGRAFGTLVDDGSTLDVTVSLTVTGTVTGTYKTADGTTPIPNAEVMLRQGTGRLLGSTLTSSHPDALGTFSFDFVPAGNVLVTAIDPLSGRIGEASGVIETQDEVLDLEIRQLGSGSISGTVTSAGAPVAAAEVRLVSNTGLSSAVPNLHALATTDASGAFVFDGVPVGRFHLRATVPGLLLVGTETGFIDTDGEEIAVEIELAASGTLTGDIFQPDETTPVPGAAVIRPPLGTVRTDADSGGRYETAFVPVGPFTLEARESSGPDAGIATGELAENEALEVDVVLNGTGTVEGEARDFDDTLLTTGTVRLTRGAPFARDESATVASDGTFRFYGIPVGTYHLALAVPGEVRRGTASGEIEVDGHVDPITIKLADAGFVTGLVVREDGATPAPNTVIEVRGTGFLLTAMTGPDGRFDVQGAPLGGFTAWAEDPVTNGVARAAGELLTAGETVDVGTLVLDTEPIEVESVTPAPGATVPPDTPVVLRFTDATFLESLLGKFFVTSGGVNVTGSTTLSPDGLELTFTPYTGGAPAFPPSSGLEISLGGLLADTFGRRLGENFTSTFSTNGAVVAGTVFDGSVPAAGVNVTLSSSGAGGSTVTDASGAYRFEDVPQGAITVQAVHPTDGRGSSASRTLGPTQGLVTVDLSLGLLGSVTGQVREHDGAPAGAGLEVVLTSGGVALATTTTAADGTYAVANVPIGSIDVDVAKPTTGDRGRATGAVSQQQSTTLDVTLQGTGVLRLFVRDATSAAVTTAATHVSFDYLAAGNVVAFEKTLYEQTTEPDGSYYYPDVLAGPVDAFASDPVSGLAAAGTGTVVAGAETVLDIVLEPAGSVRVTVLAPDGTTPAAGATVAIRRWNMPVPHAPHEELASDGAGQALFQNLPVAWAPYTVEVSVGGRLRARARDVAVADGAETAVQLEIAGLGTVTGQVLPPSGESLSSNVIADLRSLADEIGGTIRDSFAADGTYLIENVPVGPFFVTANDTLNQFLGESAGELTTDGETVVVDVQLADNGVTFLSGGNRLYDGNEAHYLILKRGALDSGGDSIFDATGEALNLEVSVDGGASAAFGGLTTGYQEESGRELVTAVEDVDGLRVQRKIFVPQDGYFARYLEIFENPGPTSLSVTATIASHLTSQSGSNGNLELLSTSSGDLLLDATDVWVVADDAKDEDPFEDGSVQGRFATAFVLAGDASFAPTAVDFQPSGIDGLLSASYDLVVPGGGRAVLMHFVSQESYRDSAQAAAERLRQLPPEALVGLGLDEIAAIVNFAVPAEGVSSVAALPPLDGRVYGQLLAHDGVTGVGTSTGATTLKARFHSDQILYRRLRSVTPSSDGTFGFQAALGATTNVVIPRTGFSLESVRTLAGSTIAASATSDFLGRTHVTRADSVSVSATSQFNVNTGPEKAVDENANTEWRVASGMTVGTLDVALPSGTAVSVDRIRIQPQSLASLSQVQLDLLDDQGQLLDSRVETFASPNGTVTIDVSPPVLGVRQIAMHFDGTSIRIAEIEIVGATTEDLGNAVIDVAFAGSAGVRLEATSASGVGLESTIYGRSVPTGIQVANGATGSDGVQALLAPFPPDIGPIDFTLTATSAAVGHTFLTATEQGALVADTTTVVSIVYPETGSITGQLTSSTGVPLSGRSMTLYPSVGSGVSKTTDASGMFAFDNLPADTYRVRHVVNGRQLYTPPVPLSPPASQVQNLQIPPFGTVDLTVLYETPEGAPAEPVSGSFTIVDGIDSRGYSTNASGVKTVTAVAGSFTVDVPHPADATIVTTASGTIATDGEIVALTVVIPSLGTVSGTVRTADGASAPSAAVELSGAGVTPRVGTSNGSGVYSFSDVEGLRPFSVLAKHPAAGRDYIFAVAGGEVPGNGGTATVDVSLPATATVEVTVTELDGTTPLPGASVSIQDSFSGTFRAEGTSGADGKVSIAIVPEGTFTVKAELPDELIGTASADVPAGTVGTTVPVTIVRSSNASIEGLVFAADGTTPLPGALVRRLSADGLTEIATRTTDAAGAYRFAATLPVGESGRVRAELPSDPGVNDEATVSAATAGETIVQDLTLPTKVIFGRVTDADGVTPAEGASVDAVVQGGYAETSGVTDANGDFTLTGVSEGSYELVATAPDGLRGFAAATLGPGQDAVTQDVLLPAFGVVEGLVLDAGGSPPVGVETGEVALHNANADPPPVATPEPTGYYRFDRVAEGAFTVVYDDPASGLSGAATSYVNVGASVGETVNIARAFGVTATASSFHNSGYAPWKVLDGNLSSSWLMSSGSSANLGGTPYLDVHFPADATVSELRIFGHRQLSAYYDIYAGRFELFDATDNVLFDSGIVDLPLPERDAVVAVPNVSGVRKVRFTSTDDSGAMPGFSELEVYGALATADLAMDPNATVTASSNYSIYVPQRAVDGNIGTSWISAAGDAVNRGASPYIEIALPESATILEIQKYGSLQWPNNYDIYSGRFELLNALDVVVFDSGDLALPAPDRDITVSVPNVGGVVKLRFTPTADQGDRVAIGEIALFGYFESTDAPPADIHLPETGSVSGQLLASGGVPTVPTGTATVEAASTDSESRGGVTSTSDTVDGAGLYHVTGVAEGDVTVTVVDDGVGEAGASTATVSAGVETTSVDLELGTAQPLPVEMGLPAAKRHLVQRDGSVQGELDTLSVPVELSSVTVNGKTYPDRWVAGVELSGRQLVLGPVRMSGLDHTRRVFVPADGSFARVLDVFENPHPFDVEVTVRLDGTLNASNLQTSSGDAALDLTDRYLAGELDTGVGLAVVVAGAGAVRLPDASATNGLAYGFTWRRLVVPAGGRVILMTYAVQASTAAAAQTEADALMNLTDPDATSDLAAAEKADIVNFIVP